MVVDKIYFLPKDTEINDIELFIDKAEELWNVYSFEWLINKLNNWWIKDEYVYKYTYK